MMADKQTIERLLKTARGQLDGILKMVEENRYCIDISNQLTATQAILKKVNKEIIAAHLNGCVRNAFLNGDEQEQETKMKEIMTVLDKIAK